MKKFNGIKYSILALLLSTTIQGSDVNGNIIKGSQTEADRREKQEKERERQRALEQAKADTKKKEVNEEKRASSNSKWKR